MNKWNKNPLEISIKIINLDQNKRDGTTEVLDIADLELKDLYLYSEYAAVRVFSIS